MQSKSRSSSTTSNRRGRKGPFPLGGRIVVLVDGNPRRSGTRARKVFNLYKKPTVRTVADFFEAGRSVGAGAHDLHWDVDRGHVAIRRQRVKHSTRKQH